MNDALKKHPIIYTYNVGIENDSAYIAIGYCEVENEKHYY